MQEQINRARHPAGAPASQGGQFAPRQNPAAATQLTMTGETYAEVYKRENESLNAMWRSAEMYRLGKVAAAAESLGAQELTVVYEFDGESDVFNCSGVSSIELTDYKGNEISLTEAQSEPLESLLDQLAADSDYGREVTRRGHLTTHYIDCSNGAESLLAATDALAAHGLSADEESTFDERWREAADVGSYRAAAALSEITRSRYPDADRLVVMRVEPEYPRSSDDLWGRPDGYWDRAGGYHEFDKDEHEISSVAANVGYVLRDAPADIWKLTEDEGEYSLLEIDLNSASHFNGRANELQQNLQDRAASA